MLSANSKLGPRTPPRGCRASRESGRDRRPPKAALTARSSDELVAPKQRWPRVTLLGLGLALFAWLPAPASATTISEIAIPTAMSGPTGIATGPDGNLWFIENGANKIGQITTAGAITEFPIPTSACPNSQCRAEAITAGPDGNLWFTEYRGNQIGRITPAGVVTQFPIPTPNSSPERITVGPDGNLWFAESNANQIGRITPAGVITEFPIPTPTSVPDGITAGPDGNVWFTEEFPGGNQIGRITPSGVVTEFPIPTGSGNPAEITAGPDGNLWFTEWDGNRIGRITPTGVVTEFPVPTVSAHPFGTTPSSNPFGITAGRDGNLWFTEASGNQIGRITPTGVITEFPIPTAASFPDGIAPGPDGNLWFAELTANKIGKVAVDGPQAITGAATAITQSSATLGGSVDPQGASVATSYHFDYGPSTAYGQSSSTASTLGADGNIQAGLTGLSPGTTYHYRLVASNATGMSVGDDQQFTTQPLPPVTAKLLPTMSKLNIAPRTFRAASRGPSFGSAPRGGKHPAGAQVRFRLNEAATVRFKVDRLVTGRQDRHGNNTSCDPTTARNAKRSRCTRRIALPGSLNIRGLTGANKVGFTGRLRGKPLAPGRYEFVAVPTSNGKTGAAKTVRFRIVS